MRAAISVIVTTRNAAERLPRLVPVLFGGVQEGVVRELILADDGSSDETLQIANAIGAEVSGPGRAAGAALARGEWLLFLDQSDQPEEGWAEAAAAHLPQRGAAVFSEGLLADLAVKAGRLAPGRALLIRAAEYRAGRTGRPVVLPVRNRRT